MSTISRDDVVSILREHYGAALNMYSTVMYIDESQRAIDVAKSSAVLGTLEQIASDLGCLKELQANW